MRSYRQGSDADGFATLDQATTRVLSAQEERELLRTLAECKSKLAEALTQVKGAEVPAGADDPQALAHYIASFYASDGPKEASLGAVFHRYGELRSKLALSNMRLVAHVAKRFRDRGISYSDLLQEGFRGLLEAIDRFDLTHETKLATYATWWIRQAMQQAVASGAYPVRLSPRHLRQLAQNQEELERGEAPSCVAGNPNAPNAGSVEMIHRIHAATRPTVSLDATQSHDSHYSLLHMMSDSEDERTDDIDMEEMVGRLMEALRPREQEVLSLRFGLGGKTGLSLSQVGKILGVSKERVRQIQDRALEKLRASAAEHHMDATSLVGA